MAGIAKANIIGNLGRDPEMRYTPNGSPVTSFSVAVSRRYQTSDGENREETEWFAVECWNKLAETANQYLQKGKQVYIEGRIRTETWDDRTTGEKRFRIKVVANEMQMLGQRGDQPGGSADDFGGGQQRSSRGPAGEDFELDTMPF
jgi:single-strand DNA-binding protein